MNCNADSATPLRDTPRTVELRTSFVEKVKRSLRDISYEPVLFLYQTCCLVTMTASSNLMLQKACRVNLNLSEEICLSLRLQNQTEKYQHQEEMLQKYTAPSISLQTYIVTGIPCLILLFLGSFSDRTGYRKFVPTIQITAQIIACAHNMIHVHYMTETGLYFFAASDAIIQALGGAYPCLFLTAFSHVAEVTSVQDRTFRLGMVYFSHSVSFPIGIAIGGPLLKHYGYYWCYSFSGCFHCVNLVYILLCIKDTKRNKNNDVLMQQDRQGFLYLIRTFFDFSNIKETIQVAFQKGSNNRRLRMIGLLSIESLLFGPIFGELAVMYMLTRYRYGWDELKFSMYQTYNFVTHTFGTVFSLVVFSRALKWHDSVLGIIATLSKIVASFFYCFASTGRMFYLAPVVEMLNGTGALAVRSIISKLVSPDELGKVNSIIGLTESVMPLIFVPLYTTVYTATMEVLPGAVFLMGATMTIPAITVFFWLFYEHRKGVRRFKEEDSMKEAAVPLKRTEESPLN